MKTTNKLMAIALLFTLMSAAMVQAQSTQQANQQQPAASNSPVTGSGTSGRVSKWTGVSGSSTFVLGDSGIFEDKFGNIGIGTMTPTSKLTVQGMIETTLGGYKFPDGTVQTTAALGAVAHDATLKGNGTANSPLGIALPLLLLGNRNGGVVLQVINQGVGDAASFQGGDGDSNHIARHGVIGTGGSHASPNNLGGIGVVGSGGDSANGFGGNGVEAYGGTGSGAGHFGGNGIYARRGFAFDGAADGKAGVFDGSVDINKFNNTGGDLKVAGNLNVTGTKNFKIDHPLDPENKYLYHAAIESSEVLNVYSGNITTDENGDATVQLPDWFEAVNKDFRYQLTVVGAFAQAIIASKVRDNRFTIKTNAARVEVSWQVTGVRSDPMMVKHPFKLEEEKAADERGYYLSPDLYDQPEARSITRTHHTEPMRQTQEARTKTQQQKPQ